MLETCSKPYSVIIVLILVKVLMKLAIACIEASRLNVCNFSKSVVTPTFLVLFAIKYSIEDLYENLSNFMVQFFLN